MNRLAVILGKFVGEVVAAALPVMLAAWRKGQVTRRAAVSQSEADRIRDMAVHVDPEAETEVINR